VDVILKSVAPVISFDFLDDCDDRDSESVGVEENVLRQVLSNGEKRALYILNIIFEVEARKTSGQETLFIVDDIADSFDYKNKYAIVEYLKEVSEEANFSQLIFSHNFDFYRTVSGRLGLNRSNRMLANKANGGVELRAEKYQKSSPFSHWRQHLDNDAMLIASIPFLRNLAEYSGDDQNFNTLTSLLHLKSDTLTITKAVLEGIVKSILKDCGTLQLLPPTKPILELIYEVADILSNDPNEVPGLEDKVALSMAIRLKAEEFMIKKINDLPFVHGITANQTIALIKRFKADFSGERENIQLVEQVNLMTPENIHLNSFMYEPILDLSAGHLKKLYKKVKAMN
jgi:energy-coupling factor transporter ATP-binding protein EcfA2